jgi:hypothetical protein
VNPATPRRTMSRFTASGQENPSNAVSAAPRIAMARAVATVVVLPASVPCAVTLSTRTRAVKESPSKRRRNGADPASASAANCGAACLVLRHLVRTSVDSAATAALAATRKAAWYHPAALKWCGSGSVQFNRGSGSRSHSTWVAAATHPPSTAARLDHLRSPGAEPRTTAAHTNAPVNSGSRRPSPTMALR